MSTIFTFPGKAGDAIHQFPIAYHWAKQTQQKFTCWLDQNSCKIVAPLFAAQPCVEAVEFKPGITGYQCGGQPWHFGLETGDFTGHTIYHLGLRGFPVRQLTLECLAGSRVPITIDTKELAETPVFEKAAPLLEAAVRPSRVILHGQAVYAHTKSSPTFWKFLHSIQGQLEEDFDEPIFVGSDRDREVGLRTYPGWLQFDDGGDFLKLAGVISHSSLVIACGSSVAALAGGLKVPCVRVHDPIAEHPKVIWSNLGENQVNDTEIELRSTWPAFRDKWVSAKSPAGST